MARKPADSSPTTPPLLNEAGRALAKRWLDNWKHVGPVLEAERWTRLEAMTARQRADMTVDLLSLWQPDHPGDEADGLIRVQRAFALWRKKHG